MSKRVLMLRHEVTELPRLLELLEAAHAQLGVELTFARVDPDDAEEMRDMCREQGSMLVTLPKSVPIPFLAMKDGVVFVTEVEGELKELVRFDPVFKPYVPEP